MAATPFKVTIQTEPVNAAYNGGLPVTLNVSCSDVAAALATFDDMNAQAIYTVPVASGGLRIKDVIASADGVDTKKLQLRKGTSDTTLFLRDSVLANAAIEAPTRCQGLFNRVLGAGEAYGFTQRA